jgi:hypothetical protein
MRDGLVLTKFATPADFDASEIGWRTDKQARVFFIKFLHTGGTTTIMF